MSAICIRQAPGQRGPPLGRGWSVLEADPRDGSHPVATGERRTAADGLQDRRERRWDVAHSAARWQQRAGQESGLRPCPDGRSFEKNAPKEFRPPEALESAAGIRLDHQFQFGWIFRWRHRTQTPPVEEQEVPPTGQVTWRRTRRRLAGGSPVLDAHGEPSVPAAGRLQRRQAAVSGTGRSGWLSSQSKL